MNIINLDQICKIVFSKREITDDVCIVKRSETIGQWFKNLFRKNKVKIDYFRYKFEYHAMEELDDFLGEHSSYVYNPIIKKFYEKPCVVLWYSDYKNGNEKRYFDTDKEAEEYFNKLITYAKQLDVPFINFYSEK